MAIIAVIDEPSSLPIVQATLESRGHQVIAISDPREAIARCTEEGRAPDAIVVEMWLWPISGWALLMILRSLEPTRGTPILMLSVVESPDFAVRALSLGATDFLPKPFAPDELLAHVEGLDLHHEPGQADAPDLAITELFAADADEEPLPSPADEDLDNLLRDVFQAALFKGFPLAGVNVDLYVHPFAWPSIDRILASIEVEVVPSGGRGEKGCEVRIAHPAGELFLLFRTLDHHTTIGAGEGRKRAVILWLKAIFPPRLLRALAVRIEAVAEEATDLLVVGVDELDRESLAGTFEGLRSWRILPQRPLTFGQLLEALIE